MRCCKDLSHLRGQFCNLAIGGHLQVALADASEQLRAARDESQAWRDDLRAASEETAAARQRAAELEKQLLEALNAESVQVTAPLSTPANLHFAVDRPISVLLLQENCIFLKMAHTRPFYLPSVSSLTSICTGRGGGQGEGGGSRAGRGGPARGRSRAGGGKVGFAHL